MSVEKKHASILGRWRVSLEAEQLSPQTVRSYTTDMRAFLAWIRDEDILLVAVVQEDLERWLVVRGAGPVATGRRVSVFKRLFGWLFDRNEVPRDPSAQLKRPRTPRVPPPRLLSLSDIEAMVAAVSGGSWLQRRDKAMLLTMYSTGCRIGEVLAMDVPDLDFRDGVMHVTGKGRRTRIVLLSGMAQDSLREWLEARSRAMPQTDAVWIRQRDAKRMGYKAAHGALQRAKKAAGIDARVVPHMTRHSFATHMLQGREEGHGADLKALQDLLGHSSLATTERYLRSSAERLKAAHRRAHPHG